LDDATASQRDANFLFDEIKQRVGLAAVRFRLMLQLAEAGDVVDDATEPWPASRRLAELGKISLTAPMTADAEEQRHIIFDPIPRVDGIEPSADPLLELRAAVYLLSGRRRRHAEEGKAATGSA
jgi:catalase